LVELVELVDQDLRLDLGLVEAEGVEGVVHLVEKTSEEKEEVQCIVSVIVLIDVIFYQVMTILLLYTL